MKRLPLWSYYKACGAVDLLFNKLCKTFKPLHTFSGYDQRYWLLISDRTPKCMTRLPLRSYYKACAADLLHYNLRYLPTTSYIFRVRSGFRISDCTLKMYEEVNLNHGGWDTYRITYTPISIVSTIYVGFCKMTGIVWIISVWRVVRMSRTTSE